MELSKLDKKSFIICTFGNPYAIESAILGLKDVLDIDSQKIDGWTLVVKIKNKNDNKKREEVTKIIIDSKGYVEKDLEHINKSTSGKASPLDYPIFG